MDLLCLYHQEEVVLVVLHGVLVEVVPVVLRDLREEVEVLVVHHDHRVGEEGPVVRRDLPEEVGGHHARPVVVEVAVHRVEVVAEAELRRAKAELAHQLRRVPEQNLLGR